MTNQWGPPIWTLFHTLAEKIKDEHYMTIAPKLVEFIKRICALLPCPDCQDHASKYWRVTSYSLTSKDKLREFLFNFHNAVNERKSYSIENMNILNLYKDKRLAQVYNNFVVVFMSRTTSRLMTDSLHRKRLIDEFKVWILQNAAMFNQ